MNESVFAMLNCFWVALVILIMRYVIPYMKLKTKNLIDTDLYDAVLKAVKSVQQDPLFQDQLGTVKKEEVIVRMTAWANRRGITITQDQIAQLVESAVFAMKYGDKL